MLTTRPETALLKSVRKPKYPPNGEARERQAKTTDRPTQFAAFHLHKNVWESNVVDIMPHPGTSEETITLLFDSAKRIARALYILPLNMFYAYILTRLIEEVDT